MLPFKSSLRALSALVLPALVEAKLPFSSTGPEANLKEDTEVTFDPLGVAAVLPNPRADTSAAMLYTQYDRGIFTWPHTMMIGGTVPPMNMLVEHLTANLKSMHPSIMMVNKDTTPIPIESTISGGVFRTLPLNLSNFWLSDIVCFKASDQPGNDFAVTFVDNIHPGSGVDKIDPDSGNPMDRKFMIKKRLGSVWWWIGTLTLDLISLLNGLMLTTAMVMGILVADIWATTLFFTYGCHWFATILVSYKPMVTINIPKVPTNETIKYAIYQRKEGGTVIFKGRQDELERWARSTWEYKSSFFKNCLHWYWIITGTASAFCSVACMVNMRSYMQLAFLGVLVYSSLAEIIAIRISRFLQSKANGETHQDTVLKSKNRSDAIIRATLQIKSECRLEGLNWIELELLPRMPVFEDMQKLLAEIGQIQKSRERREQGQESVDSQEQEAVDSREAEKKDLDRMLHTFLQPNDLPSLRTRIIEEISGALSGTLKSDLDALFKTKQNEKK